MGGSIVKLNNLPGLIFVIAEPIHRLLGILCFCLQIASLPFLFNEGSLQRRKDAKAHIPKAVQVFESERS
jgi:hypothetical protein